MTDIEFEILDELYFVVPFHELLNNVSIEENELVHHLQELIKKGWVKCFVNISGEEPPNDLDFKNLYKNYYYLASKDGLKAHNTI